MRAISIFQKKKTLSFLVILFTAFIFTFMTGAMINHDVLRTDLPFAKDEDKLNLSPYVEGEVLVIFKKGVDILSIDNIVDSLYIDVKKYYSAVSRVQGRVYVLLKSETQTTQQMQAELANLAQVADVSPNYKVTADTTIPNDPRFNELWGLHNTGQTGGTADVDIDAPEAWDNTTGGADVIVAVIDSGIDYNHPDLAANTWVNPGEIPDGLDNDGNGYIDDIHGINAITGSGDPMDDNGHGTHCSGTIGGRGNNGIGVAGVNWNVKIMGTKFLNSSGSGNSANAIECIDYIIDQKINHGQNIVSINASYGGGGYSTAVKDAIDAAGTAGIVFCASAGNAYTNNDATPHYPSSYTSSNIISVTAVDHYGNQYYNYGAVSVDIAAPGRNILSTIYCEYTPQPGDIFYDNMAGGGSAWTHGGTLDSWAVTNAAAGGLENYWHDKSYGNFWSDSPGTGYVHNVDNWLAVANDIDLSTAAGQTVYLGFDGGFQFDYFLSSDTAAVEISNDSGTTWSALVNLKDLYTGWGYYYKKQVYTIPEAYKTANFRFRFHITSDATDYSYYGYKNRGWIIDNIGIGTDTTCGYGTKNGTSMATPHVTGAVALIASAYPTESAADRITRLYDNVVILPSLSGKCATGGMLNVGQAVGDLETITVTAPNGGESWETGSTQNITWTNTGTIDNVKIEYSIDNGTSWTEITASTPNDGSYDWTVPDNPSDNCLIRISDTGGTPSDTSDGVFSIAGPSLTLTAPNGGENWGVGHSYDITWTTTGTVGNIKIEYSVNNGENWLEIVSSTTNDGSHSWTVPGTTSESARVRVSEVNGLLSDQSDNVFFLTVLPTITVTSPNGGEVLETGTSFIITWTSTGNVGNVKIEYCTTTRPWTEITASTANDGRYRWILPETASEDFLVRVSETGGQPSDVSNDVFSILFPPSFFVTAPNGGEYWQAGTQQIITWTSRNISGYINIRYSTDNGASWKSVRSHVVDEGQYTWTVPDEPSGTCLVRVSETDGDPFDVSDAVFTIFREAAVTVTSPNGGENWEAGSSRDITWTSTGTVDNVKIEYSSNNGSAWTSITSSTANDGSFSWTLPGTPSEHCLVRVGDAADGDPSDVSNAGFSICAQPTITVTSPNGGEVLETGFSHNITWTATQTVAYVKIECSTNNGGVWRTIVKSTTNDGIFSWRIPDNPSTNCLVRVSDTGGSPSDVSDGLFSIVMNPTITVTYPNGGESLHVGDSHDITWDSTGTVGNVKIDYSVNNGSSWLPVVSSTANNGSYAWTIPENPSENCLVRVRETDGNPSDVCNAPFAIVAEQQSTITVTSPNGGEVLETGFSHNITWTTSGTVGNLFIQYSVNGGSTWATIVESTENDGNYNWTIPGASSNVSDNCLVRITEKEKDTPTDTSDAVFSIVCAAITVTSPNGGESLTVGSTHQITWTCTGTVGSLAVDYSTNNGGTWTEIVESIENDGSYDWTVPDKPSTDCRVRIRESDDDTSAWDTSDGKFAIVAPSTPVIRVIYPNGGETLYAGSTREITWAASQSITAVGIDYSIDNGDTWTEIIDSTPNDGSFPWTVPESPSVKCLIRVSDADNSEISDTSDAVFEISTEAEPSITVVSPNGGETLSAGTAHEITWTCTGDIPKVTIDYSIDSGDTWSLIVTATLNDGSYEWIVPGNPSEHCLVRIRENEADSALKDTSDAEFTIDATSYKSITVISPNGGEILYAGSSFEITWTSTEVNEEVRVKYSYNNGDSWQEIAQSTANDGSYDWTVPDTPSTRCLVRVSSVVGAPSPVSDESDREFEISSDNEPTVTVTSPNGGETLTAGTTHEVTWTCTETIEDVTIEYSGDSGSNWESIEISTPNDGSYDWLVPGTAETVSDNCLVRISGIGGDMSPSDESDGVFSITIPDTPTITVTSPNGGENLLLDTVHEITWTSTGEMETVMIEYTADSGGTWLMITASTTNTGSYEWTVPDNPSENCMVRIRGNDSDEGPSDTSDNEFVIVDPQTQIIVTYPNGGETFYEGLHQEITWTAPETVANVTIEYSIDGGAGWITIVTSTANDGILGFIVPETPSETCLIRVSDADGDLSDVSDAVFVIAPDEYNCGFGGIAYEKNPDGSTGPEVSGLEITFVSEDGSFTRKTVTNGSGYYRVPLPAQRYRVTAEHPDFHPYSSTPGFFVVTGNGYQTGNFFLTRK